jgi:hypothetical protein
MPNVSYGLEKGKIIFVIQKYQRKLNGNFKVIAPLLSVNLKTFYGTIIMMKK